VQRQKVALDTSQGISPGSTAAITGQAGAGLCSLPCVTQGRRAGAGLGGEDGAFPGGSVWLVSSLEHQGSWQAIHPELSRKLSMNISLSKTTQERN